MRTILLISPYWKEEHRWMVSTVKLAELWQRLGFRVIVVCMGGGGSRDRKVERSESRKVKRSRVSVEKVSDTLEIHRMKDFFLPDPWNYGIALGFTGYVRRLIKEEKPDIVVANKILFWTTLSVIALRLTGHKVIVLTDALVGMTWWPRNLIPKICSAVYAWTAGWLILLCAKKIVFFHPQPESLLKKLGIAKKAEVIPTGIDNEKFSPLRPAPVARALVRDYEGQGIQPTSSRTGRSRSGAGLRGPGNSELSKGLTITYIGRLESVKGVDDFLAACVPLKSIFPDINIKVVGWHKEGHPLVDQYQSDVVFTGLRDDIPEILEATDIFVLPSYSEGLSNALMEAMTCGCACIATEVGGNRYLIQNGVSGFFFPSGDREALKAHLRRLIEDEVKRKALGEAARKRIEEAFDWKVVGEKYRRLFEECLL